MGESKPPAFYANLESVRIYLFGLLVFGLLIGLVLPSLISDALDAHARMHVKAVIFIALLPITGFFLLIGVAWCLRMLVRNPPILTILPEGLLFDVWGLVIWRDVQAVEVRQVITDPKKGTSRLAIVMGISDLKLYNRNRNWVRQAFSWGRDWSKPVNFFQLLFERPVAEIAASIEAHRPKAPTA